MKQLSANGLKSSEFARQSWWIVPAADEQIVDMLQPGYWAHVAAQLRPGDKIECLWEDNSRYAEFVVLYARRLEASVMLVRDVTRGEENATQVTERVIAEYEVVFRGQRAKHCVVRGKDVVKSGFESEAEAKQWLGQHLKALAA